MAAAEVICAEGVLASLRRVSKRLLFADLERADGGAPVELVFKDGVWCGSARPGAAADASLQIHTPRACRPLTRPASACVRRSGQTVESLVALRARIRQGDVIRVRGVRDDAHGGAGGAKTCGVARSRLFVQPPAS
jgi:hypothetical protein